MYPIRTVGVRFAQHARGAVWCWRLNSKTTTYDVGEFDLEWLILLMSFASCVMRDTSGSCVPYFIPGTYVVPGMVLSEFHEYVQGDR